MSIKTSVDKACEELGIGKDRRVISSKGRHGVVQGVEYNVNDKGALWVMLANGGGAIRVPRAQFKVTPTS